MNIQVAGFYNTSNVNGEGLRSVIFFSGCKFNCDGCHNKEIQDPNYGKTMTIDEIMEEIKKNIPIIDGVTLSGGEPTLQLEQSLEIIKRCHKLGLTVWMYTGDTYENMIDDENKKKLLEEVDVIIDGRFDKNRSANKTNLPLLYRGSWNQRIIDCKKSLRKNQIILWDEREDF